MLQRSLIELKQYIAMFLPTRDAILRLLRSLNIALTNP